mmetsp:Transcript_7046/g.29967  ORF Transcript_7046/g.29967 Transcript_7046/m.29967 type:complete len:240 (+) Transcript_7046:302-1021(+)
MAVAAQQLVVGPQQRLGGRGHRGLGRAHRAVVDLQGQAQAQTGQSRAVDALGADLAEQRFAQGMHHTGVEAVGAADHEGLGRDGPPQPLRGQRMAFGQPLPGRAAGEGQRQRAQRQRKGRDRAAVDAARRLLDIHARGGRQRGRHLAHHRMLGSHIAACEGGRVGAAAACHQAGDADKAAVLAGTVVVQRRGLLAARQHAAQHRLAAGPLRAALQRVFVQAQLGQHARGGRHMRGLSAV